MTSSFEEKIAKLKTALENVFLKKTDVKDNLTSSDTDKPLSAKQGKWLKDNAIQTAGTNLSKSGVTLNHATSGVGSALTTATLKKIKYDSQGHITGVADAPTASTSQAGIVQLGTGASNAATGNHTHSSYVNPTIVDNLTTNNASQVLSAKQGYILNNQDAEYVEGTHGTTATGSWTGTCTKLRTIQKDSVILFKMTSAGSGNASLTLTLADGSTFGPKDVYYNATTRFTTHLPINTILNLVYDGTKWINTGIQNTNNYDRTYACTKVKNGENGQLNAYTLIYGKNDGKHYKLASGGVLDVRFQILYNNANIAKDGVSYNVYTFLSGVNIQNTISGITRTANEALYIEGSAFTDGQFTITSNVLVSESAVASGKYYIPIGAMENTTSLRFTGGIPTVFYHNGTKLVPVEDSKYATTSHTHSYVPTSAIKNDLTTGGATNVLSAEQGKTLQTNKLNKNADDTSTGYITAKGFKVSGKSNFLKADGTTADANNYSHPTYTSKTNGLYKITVDGTGHVSGTASVGSSDLPSHTHTASDLPSTMTPSSHTHGSGDITGLTASKNVVTGSDGKLTTEDKYTHPSGTAKTGNPTANQTPTFGSTFTVTQFTSNAQGHISGATDRTVKIPNALGNGTTAGLSTNDYTTTEKTKLGNIAENANNYSHPNSGVTAGTNQSSNQTPAFNATFNIPKLTYDAQGHITASANSTVKIPALPTANTSTAGIVKLGTASGTAAEGNHTHNYLPTNANGTTTGTLTATKFINSSSNNTNILLGNGNTLAQSTFATASHTHSASDLPSTMTPSSHTHGNLQNDGAVGTTNNASKNVVTDGNGKITTEDKPIIPKVFYGTCATAAGTQIKEITASSDYVLQEGTVLIVKFTNAQTYNASASNPVKLKINNAATNIDIAYVGTTKTTRYLWNAGEVVTFIYDGTNFIINKGGLATTTYYGLTKLSSSTTSTSESLAATPKAVKAAYDLANGKADASHNHGAGEVLDSAADAYANLGTLTANADQQTINYMIDYALGNKSDSSHTHNYAASNHNHSDTYVDGAGTKNSTNGSAIAEIKANTTVKGTIYHPKVNTNALTGVPTANTTIGSASTFTVSQPSVNTDGHVTALTTRTYTLPTGSTSQKGILQIGTGSGNAAAGNHTHTVSNITDFPSIPTMSYTLRQTITANNTTIKVYSNSVNVYIKFNGTPTLTANTNYSFTTKVNTDYCPISYEYGLLGHANANIFGAVNSEGVLYIINKTSATSTTVAGSIMYPLKSTLP